uniref:Ovule protein n=1 Tax=Panagrellus redivivus TaxID=6233 RepID=A0A7E4VKZ0_PANRE
MNGLPRLIETNKHSILTKKILIEVISLSALTKRRKFLFQLPPLTLLNILVKTKAPSGTLFSLFLVHCPKYIEHPSLDHHVLPYVNLFCSQTSRF